MDNSKAGKGSILNFNSESMGIGGDGGLWKSGDIFGAKNINGGKTLTLKC